MNAKVSSYGDQETGGVRTVQHWQLHVNGRFVADTSVPEQAELFREIAHALNRSYDDVRKAIG